MRHADGNLGVPDGFVTYSHKLHHCNYNTQQNLNNPQETTHILWTIPGTIAIMSIVQMKSTRRKWTMPQAKNQGVKRWSEPPTKGPRKRSGYFDVDAVLSDLKAHPGEWGVIAEGVSASYAQSTLCKNLKAQGCDIAVSLEKGVRVVRACLPTSARTRGRRAAA